MGRRGGRERRTEREREGGGRDKEVEGGGRAYTCAFRIIQYTHGSNPASGTFSFSFLAIYEASVL